MAELLQGKRQAPESPWLGHRRRRSSELPSDGTVRHAARAGRGNLGRRVGGVEGPFPYTYALAFLRFAQYAFIRLDSAFRAAALIPRRFCLGLDFVLG